VRRPRTLTFDLGLVDQRHPEIRGEKQGCPAKLRRRHAEDCIGVLVELNGAAHHGRVALIMVLPIDVAQHDVRSTVRTMLIGAVEEAAEVRLNPQDIEVIAAAFVEPRLRGALAVIEASGRDSKSHDTFEPAGSVAHIEVIGVRLLEVVLAVLDHEKIPGPRKVDRAQHQRIQNAEHHGICRDSTGQRQNSDHGKSRGVAHHAETVAYVPEQRLEEVDSFRISGAVWDRREIGEELHNFLRFAREPNPLNVTLRGSFPMDYGGAPREAHAEACKHQAIPGFHAPVFLHAF